ncbi:MAG: aminotransferase class IV [Desulfomonile tiedjei]|nr:aminotransferase class IV [Desulfomonile tiedjei]
MKLITEGRKIISYQRDHYVDTSDLVMPFLDDVSGTIRGYRIFTACRTVRGKIFRLEDHLDRLYYSASAIFMIPPLSRDKLRELLAEVVQKNTATNPEGDLLIDVVFSGGLHGSTMKQSGAGAHLYIAVQPMEPPPPEAYEKGVPLATFPHLRLCPDVKLLNYIGAVLAHSTVVPQQGAWDVLFVDPQNRRTVLEGSTFTIFFVEPQGDIVTPPLNGRILDSITRRVVLEVCSKRNDLNLREEPLTLDQVISFPEAFLASTTRNVLPVTRVDDTVIGTGLPGPVTRRVMEAVQEYLESY